LTSFVVEDKSEAYTTEYQFQNPTSPEDERVHCASVFPAQIAYPDFLEAFLTVTENGQAEGFDL
jgi:hypothetical protein